MFALSSLFWFVVIPAAVAVAGSATGLHLRRRAIRVLLAEWRRNCTELDRARRIMRELDESPTNYGDYRLRGQRARVEALEAEAERINDQLWKMGVAP